MKRSLEIIHKVKDLQPGEYIEIPGDRYSVYYHLKKVNEYYNERGKVFVTEASEKFNTRILKRII